MRILTVTTSFPRHEEDHAGRFVHDLHAALCEMGHDVLTICPEAPAAPEEEEGEAGRVIRVPYTPPGSPDLFYGEGVESNVRTSRSVLSKMRRFIESAARCLRERGHGADAVLAHWIWPSGVAAVRGTEGHGTPVVGIGHGADLHLLSRPAIGRILARPLVGALSGAYVTTSRGAELIRRRLRVSKVLTGPMGTDPARFARVRSTPPPWGTGYILGLGRLVPIKGFDTLVAAAAKAEVPLVVAGEGPERARLEAQASDLGTDLLLPGHVGPLEAARAVVHARAVVIPSRPLSRGRTEGTPVVAVEALVAGTPVIASATGGLPELLPADALFPSGDTTALSEKLRRLGEGWLPTTPEASELTRTATASRILGLLQ